MPDFTSWWPRPKAEGVVEELAKLQGDTALPLAPGPASALPPGVRGGGAFPRAAGTGYDVAQVDAFMAEARGLSASAIRDQQFATARRHAYDTDAVDDALRRLEAEASTRET